LTVYWYYLSMLTAEWNVQHKIITLFHNYDINRGFLTLNL